jgi:E3 ubiquitin-protein ligase HERC1
VKDIGEVGQVACGSVHTVAVSQDGKTVWSFGSGDNGKLGHGDMNRCNKPKVIESFCGMHIRKVACSGQASLALTSTGQVRLSLLYLHFYIVIIFPCEKIYQACG